MKRILALVLALAMLIPGTLAAAESQYADPIDFSYSFLYMDSAIDYSDENLNRWVEENFNVDIEYIFNANSGHGATVRSWVYGGTMPDVVTWDSQTQSELVDMADQELIAPLPEGWEETYPNLYAMYQKTGLYELMKVDGKTYSVPHAVFCNFLDVSPVPEQDVLHYRKDWARELGYDFENRNTITMSELKAFVTECVEKDMAGNGATLGLTDNSNWLVELFMKNAGIRYTSFARDEENQQYVFNPSANAETIAQQLGTIREWYKAGLIDPDFYVVNYNEAYNKFCAGMAAAIYGAGHVDGFIESANSFNAANPDKSFTDSIGQVLVTNDDGTLYEWQATNHYSYSIFNGEIEEDKLNRILSIMDFFCTKEGEYYCWNGVKGVDWDYSENGEVLSGVHYPSSMGWCFLSIVSDDYGFANVAKPAEFRARAKELTELKSATAVFNPYPFEYAFHTSEAKSNYSVSLTDKVVELIMNDADILTEWNDFLTQFDSMVDPLLNELNEVYFGK